MNDRNVDYWAERLVTVFGEAGDIGEVGERIVVLKLQNQGFTVDYFPNHQDMQNSGIDLVIYQDGEPHGIDVKANLHTGGDVGVEWRKLFKTSATYWYHINNNDPDDFFAYKTDDMITYLKTLPHLPELYWVPRTKIADLVPLQFIE